MSRAWALLLRGMRWRLIGSILIVLTAAIAMGTAIIGPLYLQAGGDSLIKRAVAAAEPDRSGFTMVPVSTGVPVSLGEITREHDRLLRRPALRGVYGSPTTSAVASVRLASASGSPYASQVASRTRICSVLHFASGGCGLGPNDVVISTRTAHALKAHVGDTITVSSTDASDPDPQRLHVTGTFRVPDEEAPYWFEDAAEYFQFGKPSGPSGSVPELDDLFVASATVLGFPRQYAPALSIQTPVRPRAIGVSNARRVSTAIAAARQSAALADFTVTTGLGSVLSNALHQRRLMDTIVAVAAVQLVLLAIWVLAAVLLRSADLRRSELRVARLRGFPGISMLTVAVAEPALLCAVGAVLGVIGAWVGVRIATAILFVSGTTVSLDAWVFIGFAAAALTICGVLGLSAVRLLNGSELERTSPAAAAAGRSRFAADIAILVVSVVALIAAATSGALASHSDPIAAAAPAAVALGTSVLAIRLVEFLCRRASRATVDSPAVASFLAVRQIGRRPAALRESRTLVIALCLACFAVSAWSVARTNRSTAATFSVGAAKVVTVTPHGVGLQQAVDRVDPHGHYAMAAVEVSTSNENLLGVDAARLPGVISWPAGVSTASVAQVSAKLAPAVAPEVDLPAHASSVSISAAVSASGIARTRLAELNLSLWVDSPSQGTQIVSLGTARVGSRTYRGTLGDLCAGGCRVQGIGVVPKAAQAPSEGAVEVTLSGLDSQSSPTSRTRPLAHPDLSAADWRSTSSGVQVHEASTGVSFVFPASVITEDLGADETTPPMASVADYPANLPAVAGTTVEYTATQPGELGRVAGEGLDGNPVSIKPVIAAGVLPRLGADGAIVDLTFLQREQTETTFPLATDEVWLGSGAPANTIARLKAAGLNIDQVQRASTIVSQGKNTGPALAYDFMLLATIVALLTAAVSTFGVLAAGARQRASELTSLEVTGVPRRVLVRSLGVEAAILAVTALFGAGAGAVGAAIAIPSLPQLGSSTSAPLSYALPVLLILVVALAAVLVVIGATALAGRGILSAMSPSLLRAAAYDAD